MSEAIPRRPVCAVAGVGPGNGEAFARRFAAEDYAVALLARRKDRIEALAAELANSRAFACDVTQPASVEAVFAAIEAELGPIEILIYNAGKGVWGDVETVTSADFEEAWRINALGLFLTARRVIPASGPAAALSSWWGRPPRSAGWPVRRRSRPPKRPKGRSPSRSRVTSGRRAYTCR